MRAPELTLAVETSNPSAWEPGSASRFGVAVGHPSPAGVTILAQAYLDPTRANEDHLAALIDAACRDARVTPRDLSRLAVSVGPGGFTAVRIAVASAKMIAEATGAACISVPSALALAHARSPAPDPFAIALASKGETAYLVPFAAGGAPVATAPGAILDADGSRDLLARVKVLVADRYLPTPIARAATDAGVTIEPPRYSPAACLIASLGLDPVDPLALAPIYPREPEAVTKWRTLHPRGSG